MSNAANRVGRLERIRAEGFAGDAERAVAEVAESYGLDPAEVRVELSIITAGLRQNGPRTAAETVARIAEEYGLPEADVWDDYTAVTGGTQEATR